MMYLVGREAAGKAQRLNVALLSLGHRSRAMLQFFFLSTGRSAFAESSEDAADVVIFDYDVPDSRKHWETHCDKHGRTGILLSVTQQNEKNTIWVQKPFTQAALLTAAREIWARREGRGSTVAAVPVTVRSPAQERIEDTVAQPRVESQRARRSVNPFDRFLQPRAAPQPAHGSGPETGIGGAPAGVAELGQASETAEVARPAKPDQPQASNGAQHSPAISSADVSRYCGDREDVSPAKLPSEARVFFSAERYLIDPVRAAYQTVTKWRVPAEIDVDGRRIILEPSEDRVYLSFGRELLSQLCAAPLENRYKPRTVSLDEFEQLRGSLDQFNTIDRIETFVWEVSLECSRGCLPKGTRLDQVLYLSRWPNLTRLPLTPHAIRIAALWANRGASLLETTGRLHIPQREIFAFYNATSALSLITHDGAHLRGAEKEQPHRSRRVLGRLLSWLRGGK